jgi:hypothetical protein
MTMKVIFAGPTLHGVDVSAYTGFRLLPPARQGDVYRAVQDGANVIGLIDGVYEYVPAIWHKEILFGLSKGVRVFGGASMGALRAAECAAFGMIGLGRIYEDCASGALEDDADVAQAHGPAELGFLPLSEPLVNVRATLGHCLEKQLISAAEHQELLETAASIFFKERTYRRVLSTSTAIPSERARELGTILKENAVDQKLADALVLMAAVLDAPDERVEPPADWTFEKTTLWADIFPD